MKSEDDTFAVLAYGECRCGKPGKALHSCCVYDDPCNCCKECIKDCRFVSKIAKENSDSDVEI